MVIVCLECCFAMVPVFRSEDTSQASYPRPTHLPIKTHSSRTARSSRSPGHVTYSQPITAPYTGHVTYSPHSPGNPQTRMTVSQYAEEVSKFCEFHSRHAAYHLAHNVHLFMRDHTLPPPITQSQFMEKFLEGFRTHFESGYRLAQTGEELKCTDETCCKSDIKSSKLKQIKDLVFGKTQWSDINGQPVCSSNIIKCGSVNLLTEKSNDFVWQKIWLLLTCTDAGNMLYIYTTKSGTPTKAIKCCQLKEARPTRSSEDNSNLSKNAFVIKINPGGDYILHAQSKNQRNDWVRTVRAQIPSDETNLDDLSDSDGEEDGRSNTGFSSASTGSHSTSTSDSLEATSDDGPTHLDINDFRAVSEHELLSERRIPKPNSYSSLPHATPKDLSWSRRLRLNRGGHRDIDGAPLTSLSLPSSRSASRHSHSRSNSPDCMTKQRSNSLRHDTREARNNVFMPSNSNSLPAHTHQQVALNRNTSMTLGSGLAGSDSSLPSGTSSTHSSLGRVYSAPAASTDLPDTVSEQRVVSPTTEVAETYSQPARYTRTTCIQTPLRAVPRLPGTFASAAPHHTQYLAHTYTNIPPAPVATITSTPSTPSTITPSTSSNTGEEWIEHCVKQEQRHGAAAQEQRHGAAAQERHSGAAQERHGVPPLKKDCLVVNNRSDTVGNLLSMPWFHSHLSRHEAVSHVTMGGSETQGRFLVRKSDTNKGDFVLTFNYGGSAKHLRMKVTELGCQINHLQFDSVEKMIEHFKKNPIPLDNTADNQCRDVRLTDFIPSDLQDEGTPVPSVSTTFFPPNPTERPPTTASPSEPRAPSFSPMDRPRSRTPPERPPRNDTRTGIYKGATSRV